MQGNIRKNNDVAGRNSDKINWVRGDLSKLVETVEFHGFDPQQKRIDKGKPALRCQKCCLVLRRVEDNAGTDSKLLCVNCDKVHTAPRLSYEQLEFEHAMLKLRIEELEKLAYD